MVADWFATVMDREGFTVTVQAVGTNGFEVGASDTPAMIGLLLRRQRERSGLTMKQVAKRLGMRSVASYARYEGGRTVPTVDEIDRLLRVVAPGRALVLQQSAA